MCLSPLRDKLYLQDGKEIDAGRYRGLFMSDPSAILGRDFNDCVNSDVVLVNVLGITTPSLGTAMEIAWAYDRHIPIVLVAEEDNPHRKHPLINAACQFKTDDLDEGLALVKTILAL
jgi:nucleoside 2-deoxyribosyltransferase